MLASKDQLLDYVGSVWSVRIHPSVCVHRVIWLINMIKTMLLLGSTAQVKTGEQFDAIL